MLTTHSGIVLPATSRVDRSQLRHQYRCMVPGCGEVFPAGYQHDFEQHTAKCAARNMDKIRAVSPREMAPAIFGDVGVDVEYRDWLRKKVHGGGSRRP